MLTKIFPTGKGKGYGPVEYLCSVNPFGRGEREKAPQVLSGNPALIRRQIDAVPFRHKYTSGVHSFAPEDNPTDDQIMEVIEATEGLAFAGLPLSSRSILWVKHEHAGRTELHFLIPRQEVNSGKSFNAFPPGWQQKYDPLRDKFNYKYGWARPDDPERARQWQPGINAKILQDAKRGEKQNPRSEVFSLTDDLANMAIQGKLANRSEIVSELRRRGYGINRQGKDYLTIVDQNGKKTRLKGTLFEENFNGPEWIKAEIAKIDKPNSEKVLIDLKLAEEADAKLQEAIRKTTQYNINRYSLQEEKNEQSAGKQPITKSEIDQGNLGSSNEGYSGKPTAFQESIDGERNESNALYSEYGLGKSAEIGSEPTQRENVQSDFRENPIPDGESSSVGRTVGKGSEMAESHRRAVEHIHERSNKNSQDSFGAGSGDYRGEPGKPGRHDEADHGQPERVARQSFQSGKLIQDFRSLKKDTEKLEARLVWLNQADKKLPDFELDLRPCIENLDKVVGEVISTLRQANETRLLRNLLDQSIINMPIKIDNLLITGHEAAKWLRAANEQNLLQKLAKVVKPLILPNLDELSFQAEKAQHDLEDVFGTRILATIFNDLSFQRIDYLGILEQESKAVIYTLRQAANIWQFECLTRLSKNLALPSFKNLAVTGKMACDLLRNANDLMILNQVNRQKGPLALPDIARFGIRARFVSKRLKTVHETSILTKIFQSERNRRKIIKNCYFHAEWAGSNLPRWNKVFAEYAKSPKKLKILNELIDEAHGRFLGIMVEMQNMGKIEKACAGKPLLMREYAILKEKWELESALNEAAPEKGDEEMVTEKIFSIGPKYS